MYNNIHMINTARRISNKNNTTSSSKAVPISKTPLHTIIVNLSLIVILAIIIIIVLVLACTTTLVLARLPPPRFTLSFTATYSLHFNLTSSDNLQRGSTFDEISCILTLNDDAADAGISTLAVTAVYEEVGTSAHIVAC